MSFLFPFLQNFNFIDFDMIIVPTGKKPVGKNKKRRSRASSRGEPFDIVYHSFSQKYT